MSHSAILPTQWRMYLEISERVLQRAVQAVLSDPQRRWTCADGTQIQVVASGIINVHGGPDLHDMAILHDGVIYVGNAEVHRRASEWGTHGHADDGRYASLLLHVVLEDDAVVDAARWTLVLDAATVKLGLHLAAERRNATDLPVDELQQQALRRLLRMTAAASVLVRRLGAPAAMRAMATAWIERMLRRRHRPVDAGRLGIMRSRLDASPMGLLVRQLSILAGTELVSAIDRAERVRIAYEGRSIRRELFVNAVLPVLCAVAADEQRIALFGWFWSADSVHPYGHLRRRFPELPQDRVWQQQGMLEFLRSYGERSTVCADITRSYGLEHTMQFLRLAEAQSEQLQDPM
ncbi:MAG: DUF2851 family protein [Candidatus Kapabacteria bacterium]|nr:DUF2851 family protein [Candidatus Kapabacteria bacterium]